MPTVSHVRRRKLTAAEDQLYRILGMKDLKVSVKSYNRKARQSKWFKRVILHEVR